MAALFEIRELAKVYRMGEVEVHALRDVNLTLDEGRVRRAARPVRFGQVDAAQHHRRPRRADQRTGVLPRDRS